MTRKDEITWTGDKTPELDFDKGLAWCLGQVMNHFGADVVRRLVVELASGQCFTIDRTDDSEPPITPQISEASKDAFPGQYL